MIRSDREGPAQPGSSNGAPTPKHGAARRLLAIATVGGAVALIVLALLSARADAAPSGCVIVEPVEGLPELPVQVENECPPPDPAPVCARGFAWGGQCWTRREGQAFASWLRDHGASPWAFAKRHPELARTFGNDWPGPNWALLDRSFPRAVKYSADHWNVSAAWLTSCAASEGGTNPAYFAIGTHGDSGWWQFLPGTWAWMSNAAWTAGRGHNPPAAYKHIRSVIGQAWTAGWAFSHGLQGHWYGRGC